MVLTIDTVHALLDAQAEALPPALFEGLNGGISLLEEAREDPSFPPGELYILGEYHTGALGCRINLYYGSFAALARQHNWSQAVWERELRATLTHELTHHLEHRAGAHALDDRDARELEAWRRRLGREHE